MAQTKNETMYDIVIFGASGFTGKYVIREALKFLNAPSSPLKSLALAGRNAAKLAQSLKWAAHPKPPPELSILTADTSDSESLRRIASQTRLILNCVGPFRFYGEPVVAACVETGCDYLDICGEPEFMELMEAKYHEKAVENGSLVVSACGFDSIPSELGFIFNSRKWASPARLNRIEAYLCLESEKTIVGNFATYESAVLGVANADILMELRKSRPKRSRPKIPGPPPPKGSMIEHEKKVGLWAVKLPSADCSVVRRTLAMLSDNPTGIPGTKESLEQIQHREAFWSSVKPAHFGKKIGYKSLLSLLKIIIMGIFIGVLSKTEFGRWALLKFPSFFSLGWFKKKGPSEDEVASASFKMWFIGKGYSNGKSCSPQNEENKPIDMEIVTRVMGPEIGYLTTPIILLQCGLILLCQRGLLPKGGVYTPGAVFGPTDLQERLEENGISFDFVSESSLPLPS